MMSRALLLVSCLAALAAAKSDERYKTYCGVFDACGGKELCCTAGGKMDKHGVCSYSNAASCYLCEPVDGLAQCATPTAEDVGCSVKTDEEATVTAGTTPTVGGSGAGNGLPTTTPNSGTTMTTGTYDGMKGWDDIPASRFYSFTEFYQGLTATIPSFYTKAPYTVKYVCESAGMVGVAEPEEFSCNIFLFTYRCPPCESRAGNVGAQLLAMDDPVWYPGNCGPTFKLDKDNGYEHKFVSYSAEVPNHSETKVILQQDVQFMFWAIIGKSVACQAKSEAECADYPVNCYWDMGSEMCKWRVCDGHKAQGPFGSNSYTTCTTCVGDEEEFIPEVKM